MNVAKWLACVYRSLDEFDHNEELMAKLKDIVMVPLMSGEVVSLATKTVFFPIDSAEQMRLQTTKTGWRTYHLERQRFGNLIMIMIMTRLHFSWIKISEIFSCKLVIRHQIAMSLSSQTSRGFAVLFNK